MTVNNKDSKNNPEKKSNLKGFLNSTSPKTSSTFSTHSNKTTQSNSLSVLSEEILNLFENSDRLYEIEDVVAEYKALNADFLKAMDRLENIFLQESVYVYDIKHLNKLKPVYIKRAIRKSRKDNFILHYNIFTNVLNSTLKESYEKSISFWGSDNLTKWDTKLNEYREFFIQFGGKYGVEMIQFINMLYTNLKDLYIDFNIKQDSFQANFDFNTVNMMSEKFTDIEERKAYFNLMILNCRKMCLSGQISDANDENQAEFINKCKKAIEIIDFEEKYFSTTTHSDSSVGAKNKPSLFLADNQTIEEVIPEINNTLNRQFLALYYMLNAIDSNVLNRNKSETARFIQMLTGKSYENIYKKMKNPIKDPSERTSKIYQNDTYFVIDCFRKLGLNKIAETIQNDNLIA